jgi:50S ribosomal protein L16 3-hydroxylase
MKKIPTPLGTLSTEQFLKQYWQKKPLLITQAFPDFESPISADELAGLACEADVNSRIVIEKDGEHPWQAIFGPMNEDIFARLPKTHWTLLVNDAEKHCPELAWIVDQFRFIPEWRFDDLMISYAPAGGSVGPHMDLYDVFILQAKGHRRWMINTQAVTEDNQLADTNLRVQKEFNIEQEWLLAPGDMIYIPPGVSHHGVATDDCMSFSIGFRANSHADMLNDFIAYISQNLPLADTYKDSDLKTQSHSNEITQDAIERVSNIFKDYLKPEHPELIKWFGRYSSDTKTDINNEPEQTVDSITELQQHLTDQQLLRHPASRFAFSRLNNKALLFIDGEDYQTSIHFSEQLCNAREINLPTLLKTSNQRENELIINLYNQGKIYIINK